MTGRVARAERLTKCLLRIRELCDRVARTTSRGANDREQEHARELRRCECVRNLDHRGRILRICDWQQHEWALATQQIEPRIERFRRGIRGFCAPLEQC